MLSGFANGRAITDPDQATGVLQIRPDRSFSSVNVRVHVKDSTGLEDMTVIVVSSENKPPQFYSTNGWTSFGSSSFEGSVASRGPSIFTMDPAWFEAGCLQFRDLDGDPLTIRVSQRPRLGSVDLTTAGSNGNYSVTIMYKVDHDEVLACHRGRRDLTDSLTVQARDPYGGVASATMNISFEVVNTPPECAGDSASTPAGVPVLIGVLANDSDPDEDTLTLADVSTPANGTASIVGSSIRYTPDPGVCGVDTFSYTANDGYGGSTTASVSVTVLDNVKPVAVCQNVTLYLDANGEAILDPTSLNGGSTDNCGIARFEASKTDFECANVGSNTVTLTVYDYANNFDTCDATVAVVDNINPVARGHDLTVQLDEFGSATIQASDIDDGSSDNCSVTLSLDQTSFTCANLGTNTVTLTATDPCLNANTVSVTVTVEDLLPPTAVCQDITVYLDANGNASVAASHVDGGSSDNCGIASLALNRDSFTQDDIGTPQSVTLTVTDTSGNASTCTAVITVEDNTPPLLTCPSDIVEQVDSGRCYATGVSLGMPTATDNCEVDWTTLTNNAPFIFPLGTTVVTWAVDDIYGNTDSCAQQVRVIETVAPTVSCPGDIQVETHDLGGATVSFSASATDNCDPSPSISCSPSSGSIFPIGDTTVTCTATDDSGNTDSCTFTVSVVMKNDPPIARNDSGSISQGGGCTTIGVLSNDSDPDNDSLTITGVGNPQCGTTAITGGGTGIRYCTEGCSDPPSSVSFSYSISDNHGGTASASVSVSLPPGPIIFVVPPPPEDE